MVRYNRYSEEERTRILARYQHFNLSQANFAKQDGVPLKTLEHWLKKKNPPPKPRLRRPASYPVLESEVNIWICSQRAKYRIVRHCDIKEKALEIAQRLAYTSFKASNHWVLNFKKRFSFSYRAMTHDSRKASFSEQDKAQQGEFFQEVLEKINFRRLRLAHIKNMDQTNVRLVTPYTRTISPIGAKQVEGLQPPGEKEGFTITLTISADGSKEPAWIVFKGAAKTGKLSDKSMKALVLPENVRVCSSKSAWWNEDLDHEYIKKSFSENGEEIVLIRDQFSAHKMDSSAQLLEKRNVQQILIPAGMTHKWQPLDVMVNSVFKSLIKVEYHEWRNAHESYTKSGYLKKPSRQEFIGFVSRAWYQISSSLVRKSFVKAEIIDEDQISGPVGEEVVGVPFDEDNDD